MSEIAPIPRLFRIKTSRERLIEDALRHIICEPEVRLLFGPAFVAEVEKLLEEETND